MIVRALKGISFTYDSVTKELGILNKSGSIIIPRRYIFSLYSFLRPVFYEMQRREKHEVNTGHI